MNVEELRQLGSDELRTKLNQWKEERFRLKFRAQTSEVKDTSTFGKLRRNIARAATILNEKNFLTKPQSGSPVTDQVAVQPEPSVEDKPRELVEDKPPQKKPSKAKRARE